MIINEAQAVGRLTEIIALEYGVTPAKARQIRTAAVLHDIGKLKIPASILNNPGKLTLEEFQIMKTHTALGFEMLKPIRGEIGEMARQCAYWHHERYDGLGYWRKPADELPFYVTVTSIADVFTALVCKRVYKTAVAAGESYRVYTNPSRRDVQPRAGGAFSCAGAERRMCAGCISGEGLKFYRKIWKTRACRSQSRRVKSRRRFWRKPCARRISRYRNHGTVRAK